MLIDSFAMRRIRTNQCYIIDVWWKMDRMICGSWISVEFCSWRVWTWWTCMSLLGFDFQKHFDPPGLVFACFFLFVCHATIHNTPPHLMKQCVSLSERHIQKWRVFDSDSTHLHYLAFAFFSLVCYHVHMLHSLFFNFSLHQKIHNS